MTRPGLGDLPLPAIASAALLGCVALTSSRVMGLGPLWGEDAACVTGSTNPWSQIFGIHVAAFGALAYGLVLMASVWRLVASGTARLWATACLLTLADATAIFVLYLNGIELFVRHAPCNWWLGITLLTLALLLLSWRNAPALNAAVRERLDANKRVE